MFPASRPATHSPPYPHLSCLADHESGLWGGNKSQRLSKEFLEKSRTVAGPREAPGTSLDEAAEHGDPWGGAEVSSAHLSFGVLRCHLTVSSTPQYAIVITTSI